MAQVEIRVNDRSYIMQCSDGEEEHVRQLAQILDAEVRNIGESVGQIGDVRLMLMAGLIVADRLSEALETIEALEDQVAGLRQARNGARKEGDVVLSGLAGTLDEAARRIEVVARDIKAPAEAG